MVVLWKQKTKQVLKIFLSLTKILFKNVVLVCVNCSFTEIGLLNIETSFQLTSYYTKTPYSRGIFQGDHGFH